MNLGILPTFEEAAVAHLVAVMGVGGKAADATRADEAASRLLDHAVSMARIRAGLSPGLDARRLTGVAAPPTSVSSLPPTCVAASGSKS